MLYTKGKDHKKYEFGSITFILVTHTSDVIIGAIGFNETLQDSKTLSIVLESYERIDKKNPKGIHVDRGYKVTKEVNEICILCSTN